jgi:truncated hemoglobin YjbI
MDDLNMIYTLLFTGNISEIELTIMMKEADPEQTGKICKDKFEEVLEKFREPSTNFVGWGRLKVFISTSTLSNVDMATETLYRKVMADPVLSERFSKVDFSKIINAQIKYITSGHSGPCPWSGNSLAEVHRPQHVAKEEFNRFLVLIEETLDECLMKKADIEGLVNIVENYRPEIQEAQDPAPQEEHKHSDHHESESPAVDLSEVNVLAELRIAESIPPTEV